MNASLNPIAFAMRHPVSVMAGVAALAVASLLAAQRMAVNVFPALDLPVIYIAQPYGGMDPGQMESQLTSYYEGHSIYMTGIHHVESKNIQGMAVIKLSFYPGTDMGGAMAEAVGYTVRARGFMPAGHPAPVPPPLRHRERARRLPGLRQRHGAERRRDDGPRPVPGAGDLRQHPGHLVAPARGRQHPLDRHQPRPRAAEGLPPLARRRGRRPELPATWSSPRGTPGSTTGPRWCRPTPWSPTRRTLGSIPVRPGENLYIRDLSTIADATDIASGYALVNGKRSIFLMVSKRADASTLAVVNALKANLARMQEALPPDMHIRFELDQSPFVTRAMWGVGGEGLLGAALTGLMVLLFLRDWRSVVVVVLNIPLALMGALVALWATRADDQPDDPGRPVAGRGHPGG